MKFVVGTQLAYFLSDRQARRNLRALFKYVLVLFVIINVFAVVFQFLMVYVEGQQHSWLSGYYWTIVTMSTLGFGDITFNSDIGRLFSVFVILSGVMLLLIVLPFAFIQYFYAPWLETQLKTRAPREVPEDVEGHVLLSGYDSIAPGLIDRLKSDGIPYFVLESDPDRASNMSFERIQVMTGEVEASQTYVRARARHARLVFVNREDTTNTNLILTVREVAPDVPIVAIASHDDSVDVLELSGANHVLPLKRWLGEHLANRVNALHSHTHVIGQIQDLMIAELPVHHTPLVGRAIRDTRLRENTGVSIVAVWERSRLMPARADFVLTEASVPVVIGTTEQLETLDDLMLIYDVNPNPVIVVGGGAVGTAAVRLLNKKGVPVHLIEQEERLCNRLKNECARVFCGNAADYTILEEAGIANAPSVVLTTNDDGMNIFLAAYCRRLNPETRIVSRITHQRNMEAIHRAEADFVLSYSSLGEEAVMSVLKGRSLLMLGEGVDVFALPLPPSLRGRTLAESGIGARTGLTVIALRMADRTLTSPPPSTELVPGMDLLMLGSDEQRRQFADIYA
jgi:voltage-gated potassium channel